MPLQKVGYEKVEKVGERYEKQGRDPTPKLTPAGRAHNHSPHAIKVLAPKPLGASTELHVPKALALCLILVHVAAPVHLHLVLLLHLVLEQAGPPHATLLLVDVELDAAGLDLELGLLKRGWWGGCRGRGVVRE
jgi:hypothetical protein